MTTVLIKSSKWAQTLKFWKCATLWASRKALVKRSKGHGPLSFTKLLVMFCIYEKFNPLNSKTYGNMPSEEEDAAFLISRHIRFILCLEKEMATHSGTLARRIPWTEEPGKLQSMGSQRVRHDCNFKVDNLSVRQIVGKSHLFFPHMCLVLIFWLHRLQETQSGLC